MNCILPEWPLLENSITVYYSRAPFWNGYHIRRGSTYISPAYTLASSDSTHSAVQYPGHDSSLWLYSSPREESSGQERGENERRVEDMMNLQREVPLDLLVGHALISAPEIRGGDKCLLVEPG